MAVRLFVGNLAYSTTEADLRTYFGAVAPPSQVVLPVDRETGRPRGFAFVEFLDRAHAEQAIQKFNGQMFAGRPLAGFVCVDPQGYRTDKALATWVQRGIDFVATLPVKGKRSADTRRVAKEPPVQT